MKRISKDLHEYMQQQGREELAREEAFLAERKAFWEGKTKVQVCAGAGVYQAGDCPRVYRRHLHRSAGECIQSSLGTTFSDGYTEKRYDFRDGTQISEYREGITISRPGRVSKAVHVEDL